MTFCKSFLTVVTTPDVTLWALACDVSILVAVVAATSTAAESAAAEAATSASVSESTAAATASAAAAEATESTAAIPDVASTVLAGLGSVHLDLLTVDGGAIQILDGLVGTALVSHGHESIALLGDVNLLDLTTSGEFVLNEGLGAPGVDSVDEQLGHDGDLQSFPATKFQPLINVTVP